MLCFFLDIDVFVFWFLFLLLNVLKLGGKNLLVERGGILVVFELGVNCFSVVEKDDEEFFFFFLVLWVFICFCF